MGHSSRFTWVLVAGLVWSVFVVAGEPLSLGRWLAIGLATYVYTDWLSGLLHACLDNERSLKVPVLRKLAKGFQQHHETPTSIYTMTLYKHLYTMHLPLAIVFVLVLLCGTATHCAYFLCLAFSLHLMQMSHRWAHMPRPDVSGTVKLLQRWRLLLPSRTHQIHHRGEFDTNFCILNGWLNPALNACVPHVGRTSHAWTWLFLASAFVPLGVAFL
jgi:hypothetical protein